MKISFNINFHTVWGQVLHVIGSIPELGSWNVSVAQPMQYAGEGNWNLEIELPDEEISFEYRYFMSSNEKLIFEEWQKNHHFSGCGVESSYFLHDYWQNRPQNQAYYSSAFIKSFFAPPCNKFERVIKSNKKIIIKVLAPHIGRNQSLCISGNQEELGNWDTHELLVMACDHFPEWNIEFDADKLTYPIEYKFCIINNNDKDVVRWENGDNRILNLPPLKKNETGIISGLQFREYQANWKCAGLVIPVFSLRSESSFGIGDFGDLKKMLDWVRLTSQKIIQILPINDTTKTHTPQDSYPYNAISIYALHPLYLNLEKMGTLNNISRNKYYKQIQVELNNQDSVDYESVDRYKWEYFHEIFSQEREKIQLSPEFQLFFEENKEWLIPYAAYSYLREKNKTCDFHQWKDFSKFEKSKIEKLCSTQSSHYKEIAIYYYLQFHLHKQMSEVRDYAYSNGIVLKGDIPIGISRTSVEAWTSPYYYNMDKQAGAPPDDFSVNGQNWGFPTYNWDVMENDDYSWWKKRFRKMSDYFDAYRIDHILGFFRIWEIPEKSVQGLLGYFNPSLPFSMQEIENAGLDFNVERFTTPHINEIFISRLFGEYTSEVKDVFLERSSSHHFALKKRFDNQRKIESYFHDKNDEKSHIIKEGLYSIVNEVLFIEDHQKIHHYHPRIAASTSFIYSELKNSDKYAFDYLYWNYFYQRHNEFWKEQAYKRLIPLISCTDMLVCGEDLGMIPHSVPEVMNKLQILSLEIERMPKKSNVKFTDLKQIPYHSVCTTSTHDMSTIRGWWLEDREKIQLYYNQVLQREGDAPPDCPAEICEQIIRNHLDSPSMLTIIPLQDWLSIDDRLRKTDCESERINIPANTNHYWRYRMHLTIEKLLDAEKLNDSIREMIEKSGRNE
ncbi:MAG: 4-alpha-glucanotransferase [Dysgonamonadaceae bacterium]|jgi:4-alpha-glucanotransferase|nr:4-alpha-glucanotransferase [Dysgonamonadaceae bacterium]